MSDIDLLAAGAVGGEEEFGGEYPPLPGETLDDLVGKTVRHIPYILSGAYIPLPDEDLLPDDVKEAQIDGDPLLLETHPPLDEELCAYDAPLTEVCRGGCESRLVDILYIGIAVDKFKEAGEVEVRSQHIPHFTVQIGGRWVAAYNLELLDCQRETHPRGGINVDIDP